ncbi:MAG TPA: flavodoxin domain-containing protein [Gaiellaceae bacterium]|nr:flavodoxin domain-containing protein [Gaiellaceae bacterium]
MKVLVAWASRHGSTREVAAAVAETLEQEGLRTELVPAAEVRSLGGCDGVVLGSALYMGRPQKEARTFLQRHGEALRTVPFAVFAMGPGKADDFESSRLELAKALERAGVEPDAREIFGGVVDPATLRFPLNRMEAVDLRDWDAIRAWARSLAPLLARAEAPA